MNTYQHLQENLINPRTSSPVIASARSLSITFDKPDSRQIEIPSGNYSSKNNDNNNNFDTLVLSAGPDSDFESHLDHDAEECHRSLSRNSTISGIGLQAPRNTRVSGQGQNQGLGGQGHVQGLGESSLHRSSSAYKLNRSGVCGWLRRCLKRREKDEFDPTFHFTLGERVADAVSQAVGSWRFVSVQSICLVTWLLLNIILSNFAWDPYPFILLNLMLSFQAAYTAPIIMMSQNRQSEIDRAKAWDLHEKVDHIRLNQNFTLFESIQRQNGLINSLFNSIGDLKKDISSKEITIKVKALSEFAQQTNLVTVSDQLALALELLTDQQKEVFAQRLQVMKTVVADSKS